MPPFTLVRTVIEMLKKYKKTNLFIVDEQLWKWAKYRASLQEYDSVSEYVFDLIKKDKEETKG